MMMLCEKEGGKPSSFFMIKRMFKTGEIPFYR